MIKFSIEQIWGLKLFWESFYLAWKDWIFIGGTVILNNAQVEVYVFQGEACLPEAWLC